MFPPPRYHAGKRLTGEHGNEIRILAGALARLLDEENVRSRWRMAPQRFTGARQWPPYFHGPQRREGRWPRRPPGAGPWISRPRALPRRGPPVAAIPAPCRSQHDERVKRRSRGVTPRGSLRGGPERPADDPQRKPRSGPCGGPARSADDPRHHPRQAA